MATLKAVVRTARADGFYPVYIRVTHHRASSFIKTDKMVTRKELTKAARTVGVKFHAGDKCHAAMVVQR